MRQVAVADIGGTHARFAIAELRGAEVVSLGDTVELKTAEHATFERAWQEFGHRVGLDLPKELAVAFAGPVHEPTLKLTNSSWVIEPALIKERLGVDRYLILNDFSAVAHAVASLRPEDFRHLCGPEKIEPELGVTAIVGPGTGLGVAALLRKTDRYEVIESEGGHMDFAPLDPLEDKIIALLRLRFGRVSVERIAAGQGLRNLYEALGAIEGVVLNLNDDHLLWEAALEGTDSLATLALNRLCMSLGSVSGDFALAFGARSLVIAGGVGRRLIDHLPQSRFRERFIAKGRFDRRMEKIPVKIIRHPQPGLFGAAAAFAKQHA